MFALVALAELCLSLAVRPEIFIGQDTARASQPSLTLPARPRSIEDRASLAQVENKTCPSEADLGSWLQELGLSGEGDPCGWQGVTCEEGCHVKWLWSEGRTEMTGNLGPLRHFTRLESLLLPETQVSGDLSHLQSLTRLSELDLSQTQVRGDLASLQHLTGLCSLDLAQTQVSGDLHHLQNLTQLRRLLLHQTQVSGDLGFLQNFTRLSKLDLSRTRVSGDLSTVQSLKVARVLGFFYASRTQLWGDLRPFRTFTRLKKLDVSQTQVSGDLGTLASLTRITVLKLSHTQVSGDLSTLQNFTEIALLDLSRTKVWGDLNPLQNLTQLLELRLSHTRVSGGLGPLGRLRELQDLDVSNTPIAGELSTLVNLTALRTADLSHTNVTGWFSTDPPWRGCCQRLRELNVAASKAGGGLNEKTWALAKEDDLLPSLQILDVSGCEMNVPVADFLLPLMTTPLTVISARSCGLHDEVPRLRELPRLGRMGRVQVGLNHATGDHGSFRLPKTLQGIDLSGNNITALEELPAGLQVRLQQNGQPLVIAPPALQQAVRQQTFLDLSGTAVANKQDMKQLLEKELKLQDSRPVTNKTEGWACALPAAGTLLITPQVFLPEDMCACQAGFYGHGVNCTACSPNTFAEMEGQASCKPCPPHSFSAGSAKICECTFGTMHGPPGNKSCKCRAGTARLGTRCEQCSQLHLECEARGLLAEEAPPEPGYVRLLQPSGRAYRCPIPSHCTNATMSGCKNGYAGPLCTDCAPGFRASGTGCFECGKMSRTSKEFSGFALLLAVVLAGCLGAAFWACRPALPTDLRSKSLSRLLAAQAPVLLQLAQLWAVLGKRLPRRASEESVAPEAGGSSDSLVSYMEVLQLTGVEVQNAFALQCVFDASTVRTAFALATPLLPLAVVAVCMCLELFRRGLGISMSLKALAILFVGGASGAAELLECQHSDGEGKAIPDDLAFRPLFPHLKCKADGESAWVDWVGGVSVFGYVIVVPCLMALLFVKQRAVMRKAKTFIVYGLVESEGKAHLKIRTCSDEMLFEDHVLEKRLVAAAASHLAVYVRGRAVVELHKDSVAVSPLPGSSWGYDALSFGEVGDQKETDILSRNDLMQMLTERSILGDSTLDRSLVGTKELLCKYAPCEKVWMEVLLKGASAVLVAVATMNSLWLTVAVALTMAAVVAVAGPFVQPEMDALQCLCFCCLALAAVGFTCEGLIGVCLTRLALLAPLLLVAAQLPYPDSPELLALRLQQELEEKIPNLKAGEPVEICAEEVRLL